MKMLKVCVAQSMAVLIGAAFGCAPKKVEPVKTADIPDGTVDPAQW